MTEERITSTYKVRTGSFEGPLELLLSLIESRKLFINEVSLSQVTDDYIAYVHSLSDTPADRRIADISYFILVTATLILIKSKSLLPGLSLTEDEEDKIADLEARLKLYQIIKNASLDVKSNFGAKVIFFSIERSSNEPLFSPDKSITVTSMKACLEEVLNSVPKKDKNLDEVEVKKVINIETIINSLTERIQNTLNVSFNDFAKSHNTKGKQEARVHVIVSFLAMLELVREGIIDVIQDNSFEDIIISKEILASSDQNLESNN